MLKFLSLEWQPRMNNPGKKSLSPVALGSALVVDSLKGTFIYTF